MLARILIILIVALIFEAVGVVLLSAGLKKMEPIQIDSAGDLVGLVPRALSNPYFLLGVLFEAIFFGALLYLLSKRDVSFVWPLTSVGFVLTTLAARYILHEHISPARWLGVLLIVIGAALITHSERSKPKPAPIHNSSSGPV